MNKCRAVSSDRPEIETRPEQEIATCEGGFGAARLFPTDTGSLFTFAEIVTAHTSQEVTETRHFTDQSQISTPHIWMAYQMKSIR